jgi:hypothetical protein
MSGGVMRARFSAAEKNAKTSETGRAIVVRVESV